jgi:hypothetical protein
MKRPYSGLFRIFLAGLFFIGSSYAHAQYEDGSLVGTIRDASGAVVSAAEVSASNTATGITERVTTAGDGDYEFPSLRPGDRAEHHDFGREPAAHRPETAARANADYGRSE